MSDSDDVIYRMHLKAGWGQLGHGGGTRMKAAAQELLEDILRDAQACCEAGLGEFAVEQQNLRAYALSKGIRLTATADSAQEGSPGAGTETSNG